MIEKKEELELFEKAEKRSKAEDSKRKQRSRIKEGCGKARDNKGVQRGGKKLKKGKKYLGGKKINRVVTRGEEGDGI